MHKLAKGLKKKKKGKKSKHKEEELFKPEELEAYRREQVATNEEAVAKNEEWRNFLSLTSGVDDILKKTQDDLNRIKSTSFFQRVPPPSETKKKQEEEERAARQSLPQEAEASGGKSEEKAQLGIVEVEESESEEEGDDDIFDTAYIDVIASGEVKLAYIPESPTDKQNGDDPFDTTIAERAILGPAVERKGKKLVPLGAAVEVLTGRVQLPTCATKSVSSRSRQVVKEKDLLLCNSDSDPELETVTDKSAVAAEPVSKTLLDDDEVPLPDEPIDLSKTLYIPPVQVAINNSNQTIKDDLKEFEEDDDDKEFEALAFESLTKAPVCKVLPQSATPAVIDKTDDWKPFESKEETGPSLDDITADDPFDTTFADNLLPGKTELKLIEQEILNDVAPIVSSTKTSCNKVSKAVSIDDDDFNPRALEVLKSKPRTLSRPDVLNVGKTVSFSVPQKESLLDATRIAKPLTPFYTRKNSVPGNQSPDDSSLTGEEDPFDTSFVPTLAPGKIELKIIESELCNQVAHPQSSLNDPDFDPRDENKAAKVAAVEAVKEINRKPKGEAKSLTTQVKSIDLLAETNVISAKVLTPAVEANTLQEELSYADPFDTSNVTNILPGKTELKLLESELIAQEPSHPASNDLLVHNGDTIIEKPLSPDLGQKEDFETEDIDPFDTSFACNIQPGRAELKVLESELI